MRDTFRIGRILGIEIGVNWSWPIVAVLIFWTLANGILPSESPGLSDGTYAAMAAVAAVVFFASLILHELGHAVVARRAGMRIDGITLWLFGGVARFRGMFPSPQVETRVAIAGPLVSLALAAAFTGTAALTEPGAAVDGVLAWLGYINVALAVFNMLPAQPLDGGRVLHGLIWQSTGDLVVATRRAARVGEMIAYTMIGGGILAFLLAGGAFGGAWLAFLGWFLLTAARLESRAVLMRHALGLLRVRDLMTPHPVSVRGEATLGEFMDQVAWRNRFTTYPVLDDAGRPEGLLRFRDVAAVPRTEWDTHRASERMARLADVPIVAPDDLAADALDVIGATTVGRALVVQAGVLEGIISISDIVRLVESRDPASGTGRLGSPTGLRG